jgi:hypothetical protein
MSCWNCPIHCGECCVTPSFDWAKPYKNGHCKNWSEQGCTLSVKERPVVCNEFLCNQASQIVDGYTEWYYAKPR